jgi:AcrR family transcriptional regulator
VIVATDRAPRRQPADVRRQQVLDAAERVLHRKGLDATTMADVAAEAGVAKGTPYLYFESKAALIAALRSRYLERFATALGSAATGGPTRRLARFVDELFAFSTANAWLHHVLFHEAGFSERDAFSASRELLAGIVADGVAAGEMTAPSPDVAAVFVLHGLHGLLLSALHSSGHERIPGAAAAARALAMASLSVSRPARR